MSLLYQSLILGSSPNAYYRLGESSGTTATDTSGNGYNGTYSASGVTYSQAGPIANDPNTCVLFDGSSGYMTMPSGVNPAGWSAITVECWFYLSNITFVNYPRFFSFGDPQANNTGVELLINASGAGLRFLVGNGTTYAAATYGTTLVASTWYHLVGTFDGSHVIIYLNGAVQSSVALTGSIGNPSTSATVARYSLSSVDFVPGRIDEVAIYNTALSAATILNHYNTALQADSSLYTVSNGWLVQTTDSNQIIKVLQQISGGQEKGGYVLGGNGYTSSTNIGMYVGSLSRTSTPVSVSIDTTDQSPPGSMGAPFTANLAMGGFQVGANYTAANTSNTCAGKYTIQY